MAVNWSLHLAPTGVSRGRRLACLVHGSQAKPRKQPGAALLRALAGEKGQFAAF